ncbi:MAG: tRNA(Ile)-lysidine synthase [Candidatus Moranbacteria bacterium GW2011_GWE2_35_2-]|nr:MAG: tRNA(Ile)-lysidine synthase [Candidatus Moranbacteria bacterium GW2011_GWE2_35_2-]KKQ22198.1 MAG: tRNA(Ile)-lysidine synthase [Candidatus Moranbacteria bacterium GW2011_GWF2_37_11]KKQ28746.1 MAG: tRNA(Ile)-lysidine synthase [Candidatus Moranbacteria bacterium GW2011_GWD1_37_17]KKQ30310.1 MAG: tRNA(Ile)-lysidine synthase [Candidatus Moranbacteria bacterium GW2011_GWE1_37_24]KKQ47364.1 MAG: tRNA(Ile)-lysidine synthase [Candidatus Moranbacteria bacterium GW2011_GWD2_37_9]HBO16660.1 tRNA l
MKKNLIKNIQNFAFQKHLWKKGDKIIIAVSGGPDSVCLLDMLAFLAPKYNLKLYIAHINYGLREKDSDGDEKYVRQLAKKYSLPISVLNAKKISKLKKGENLENKLRQIRYAFFEKILKKENFNLIAVGHNQDDLAETVLMRVLRGSGLQGLSAISAKKNNLIRPLLNTSRKEIETYLKEKKIYYRTDKTNADIAFFRNKIRHRLIPYLEKNFKISIKQNLATLAETVSDDFEYIQNSARKANKQMIDENFNKISLEITHFLSLPHSLQRQSLREVISSLSGLNNVELVNIEEIFKIIHSKKNKNQQTTFGGLKIQRKGDKLTLIKI